MSDLPREDSNGEYVGIGGLLMEMVRVFLLALVIIIPVRIFLFQPFFVQGSSMEPNFSDGEYLVVSEFGYKETGLRFSERFHPTVKPFKTLERQEAAVFHYPKNPDQYFIKRVIALPGESIEIRRGKVIIYNKEDADGFVLDESAYLGPETLTSDMPRVTLGENEYFVMGDNRLYSYDSRSIGPVSKKEIIGHVLLRAWPINQFALY